MAQGAALLLGQESSAGGEHLLAGIEDASVEHLPQPGETIDVEVRLLARLGGVVRVRGELRRGGASCGGVTLVLASAGSG